MKRARRIRRRLVKGVVLGLAVAAVAVPTAQAFDYHQPYGPGQGATAGPATTPGPLSFLARGPGFQLPAGAGVQANETTVDWSAVGVGIGMGGALALVLAGLIAMRPGRRGGPVRA
jgi:hypothetical protein